MKIGITTPLFPPDVAIPAPYVKELVTRLQATHTVTLLSYSHTPEAVPGVTHHVVDKHQILPLRLWAFLRKLLTLAMDHDILIVVNGISVELPLLIVSYIKKTPYILNCSDPKALEQNKHSIFKQFVHAQVCARAKVVIDHATSPSLNRPEIFSFKPYPHEAMTAHEAAWTKHLEVIESNLKQI